jgi:hypothetical protein
MRTIVLALGVVPILSACASEPAVTPAEPKPVLILSEWNYPLHIGHPWPIEIRLVAYDNGLVIRQPVRTDDWRTKPKFVWQRKTPAEVRALAAEAKAAALDGIEISDESVSLPLHMGWTDIWYSDPEKPEPVKLTAYGYPCAATKEDLEYEWTFLMWKATNPRFIKLCDALLGLPLADAKEWHPKEMKVTLMAVDEPHEVVPFPADWPTDWRTVSPIDGTKVELCVPVGPQPSGLTAEILDPRSDAWSKTPAVEQAGSFWWVVLPYAARVAMPGAVQDWADGPCSTAK